MIYTNSTSDRELISKVYKKLKSIGNHKPNNLNEKKKWGTYVSREFPIEESLLAEKHVK